MALGSVCVCVCVQPALLAGFIWLFWSSGEAYFVHPALHCQGPEHMIYITSWLLREIPASVNLALSHSPHVC